MSIESKKSSYHVPWDQVDDYKVVCIGKAISVAGVVQSPFTVPVPNLQFVPDYVVVKEILINQTASNVNMYALWSDLNNDIVAMFSGYGTSVNPETIVRLNKPITQLSFQILQVAISTASDGTANTMVAPVMANSWTLGLVLEFVKLKKK